MSTQKIRKGAQRKKKTLREFRVASSEAGQELMTGLTCMDYTRVCGLLSLYGKSHSLSSYGPSPRRVDRISLFIDWFDRVKILLNYFFRTPRLFDLDNPLPFQGYAPRGTEFPYCTFGLRPRVLCLTFPVLIGPVNSTLMGGDFVYENKEIKKSQSTSKHSSMKVRPTFHQANYQEARSVLFEGFTVIFYIVVLRVVIRSRTPAWK